MGKLKNRFAEHLVIKERNENRTYTYREIAAETGLSKSTVGKFMNNEVKLVDLRVAEILIRWLGIKPSEFFTWGAGGECGNEEANEPKEVKALLPVPA